MKRRDDSQPPRHPSRHPSRRPPLGRSRLRTLLKWSGTLACLLILLAAAACLRWRWIDSAADGLGARIEGGSVFIVYGPLADELFLRRGLNIGGSFATWQDAAEPFARWGVWPYLDGTPVWVSIPLWIPFVLIGVPTGWLWWRDRRRVAAGCCAACGYDLTGNVSGRCPECGALREAGTPEEVGRPKSEV